MNFEENNFFENTEEMFLPEYPLFNFEALRRAESEEEFTFFKTPFTFEAPTFFEEVPEKKIKTEDTQKKRGRKPANKNAKNFDDPTITIEEIISNDLAGIPMESEVIMKEKQLKNMREKKALKRLREKENTETAPETPLALEPMTPMEPIFEVPQIIFKDGKIVINEPTIEKKELKIATNERPYKLNSMSFRTKNHTAKWTPEETTKFYKAIEIFGADFTMIAQIFPNRTRDQIKKKFNKEEKTNVFAVDAAFNKHASLNTKRPLMDKMRNLYDYLTTETEPFALENGPEFEEQVALTRNFSNVSVETEKIMEEIKNVFIKEIKPNAIFNVQNFEEKRAIENEIIPIQNKENLLLRCMI